MKLVPQSNLDDINARSVIKAGPGDVKSRKYKSGSVIRTVVGCAGNLWKSNEETVRRLKEQARDGTISEVLGLPLVGWRLRLGKRVPGRDKRQADGK